MSEIMDESVPSVKNNEPELESQSDQQYHIATAVIFILISFGAFYLGYTEPAFQHYMIELYYVPVIIAAIAFGWQWGLFYGVASSIVCFIALHGFADTAINDSNYVFLNAIIRSLLLIFIGTTTGYLSHREKKKNLVYQKVTQILETLPNPVLAKDTQNWFNQIVSVADELLQPKIIDTFSIMLLIEDVKGGGYLRIVAAKGIPDEIIRNTRHPVEMGIVGQVMRTAKPMVCRDFVNLLESPPESDKENKVVSSLCIPLLTRGKPIGVINASSFSKTNPFDEKDLPLLVVLARAVAMTVEIADLEKGLKATYLQTIHSLARAIDIKDKYTFDHSEEVAKYVQAMGLRLKLSDREIEDLYAAALLHDIGKIGVPDSILTKNGKLTKEEYEEIKAHSVLGKKILAPLEYMKEVSNIILHHQERYDGTGYPFGLKGDQIPLGARILAVVDTFHAMTSDRVYRKALSVEVAIAELKQNKGTQFDPMIVDLFLELINSKELQKV